MFSTNILQSKSYKDSNYTSLIKSGNGINVIQGASGDFTISTSSKLIGLTSTTNSSGIATIDLTSYGFSSTPVVNCTCVQTNASQVTVCNITSVSSTSLSIKTYQTQNTLINLLGLTVNPVIAISTTVNIILVG